VTAPVDRLHKLAARDRGVIGLSGGLPAQELVPDAELAAGFRSALHADRGAMWQYGWCEGDAVLRQWVASGLRARGAAVADDDVIITAGAQQALALATAELLAAGTPIVTGPTSYAAALDLMRLRGAELVVDAAAAAPDAVRYVMPGVATPTGVDGVPDPEAAIAGGGPLIVDEAYALLRFDGRLWPPLAAWARERVWHVGTVSKILCPGLRIGWLVPPRARLAAVSERKQAVDLQTGSLAQAVLAHALDRLDLDAHVARLRGAYLARCSRLVDALHRHAPSWRFAEPAGGFAVFVDTGIRGDEVALLGDAIDAGVSFDPGHLFRAEPDGVIRFRLCFSSAPVDQLGEGVRRLAAVVERFARAHAVRRPSRPAAAVPPPG
jgi:2-aminoadipate transaminase